MSETNAEMLRRLRADAVARGLCSICRCRFPRPGNRNCDECIKRTRKYEETPKGDAARRRRERRARRRRFARRVADGLCRRCGRYVVVPGFAACVTCLDKQATRAGAIRRAKGMRPRQDPCSICGAVGHNRRRHERAGLPPVARRGAL